MSSTVRSVTDENFNTEVLASEVPVLVDYWAEWCGPCRMIAPIVDETAAGYNGRLSVAKLNIDENPKTPSQYHVRSIPALMLFKGGQPVATQVGAVSKSQLSAFLESHL